MWIWLSKFVSLTKLKVRLAGVLYKILTLVLPRDQFIVSRRGITFALDIKEGIDLSIFLFGGFQDGIIDIARTKLKDNPVILDIGANIGLMTLGFSKSLPLSKVYSFEPTDYAFDKFLKNIALNPQLKSRIFPVKMMLSKEDNDIPRDQFYSSWRVDTLDPSVHDVHAGSLRQASDLQVTSLDTFAQKQSLRNIDLIKIDTDGSELLILQGAAGILSNQRPIIIFEVGLYLLEERGIDFKEYIEFFNSRKYTLWTLDEKKQIQHDNYMWLIPKLGTVDLLALPTGAL